MGSGQGLDLTMDLGFGAAEVFKSAVSLASNYSEFILLGVGLGVAPWLFSILGSAIKAFRARRAA
jgi:hypothetical protein